MRLAILLGMLFSATSFSAVDEALIANPRVKDSFAELVALSGNGRFPVERAAFLLRLDDGTYQTRPWPFTSTFQSARFEGAIPDNTIAIVHTHPLQLPYPSAHDVTQAIGMRLPILVLTPRSIMVARPDGTVTRLVRGPWF